MGSSLRKTFLKKMVSSDERSSLVEQEEILFQEVISSGAIALAKQWEDFSQLFLRASSQVLLKAMQELEKEGHLLEHLDHLQLALLEAEGRLFGKQISHSPFYFQLFYLTLWNLIENAVEAVWDRLGPQHHDRAEIQIRFFRKGQELWLQIMDNGTGFAPLALLSMADEKPFTSKQGKKDCLGGEGMALKMAISFATDNGFRLEIHNREDGLQGACVSLVLPKREVDSDKLRILEEKMVH